MVPADELSEPASRSRAHRVLVVLVPAAVVVGLIVYGLLTPAADRQVPEFSLEMVTSRGRLSSDDLRGAPVVLNFFASWCVPCREEAPLLQDAWEDYRDEGLQMVGVSIRDSKPDARAFVEKFGITYPVVHDPQETLARRLGLFGLPETYFIDHEWNFLGMSSRQRIATRRGTVWLGPIDRDELRERIESLLERYRER